RLAEITGEDKQFQTCVLKMQNCDAKNPCALHYDTGVLKKQWQDIMANKTIQSLIKNNVPVSNDF
ncbi:MAG: hypothetical protein ABIR18_08840, partial [Chitinophagaceae bacterium]